MDRPGEAEFRHEPVLVEAVTRWLGVALEDGGVLVDCTLGGGGHAEAFLRQFDEVRVLGIDQDNDALRWASRRLAEYSDRFRAMKANFREFDEVIDSYGTEEVSAVLYDLGVSSAQLDRPERGFSYKLPADLDMRMDQDAAETAADVVNRYPEQQLSRVIFEFGEERFARRIAAAIVRRRQTTPFHDTADLAEVVRSAIPAAARRSGPHPARRTFQALRIEVNDELESLRESLESAVGHLRPGGRIAVISYHSLEDRIVKRFFRTLAADCTCPKDLPVCVCGTSAEVRILTRRPERPGEEEVRMNPRSDSARLRVAEKLGEAA